MRQQLALRSWPSIGRQRVTHRLFSRAFRIIQLAGFLPNGVLDFTACDTVKCCMEYGWNEHGFGPFPTERRSSESSTTVPSASLRRWPECAFRSQTLSSAHLHNYWWDFPRGGSHASSVSHSCSRFAIFGRSRLLPLAWVTRTRCCIERSAALQVFYTAGPIALSWLLLRSKIISSSTGRLLPRRSL